ncbi:NADPH-dependent F420 reductase [Promicromonospora sp. NPDC057138]|uniref:NADPH-dependent F420 reductase n=1 Tax=Promicromonospora sp. NPDC057138 TaxID=3346031 RepID=UPI003624F193
MTSDETKEMLVNIGLLGTGNLAMALGKAWATAGHSIVVTGRSSDRAKFAAEQIGAAARPIDPGQLADQAEAVVVAIAWGGLEEALRLVGGPDGMLSGKTVIDSTNAVDYATGCLLPETGSAAELVADLAAGAHVVKALHLFAGASWPFTGEVGASPVIAICGDDAGALNRTAALIGDLGARAAVLGGLTAARQAEEAAGFVMRVVAAGANPRFAVPDVDPALLGVRAANQ